ncbi:MAG: endonuclease [Nevskia sp.]|nr:endonuclease [Nevskia sp.]
MTAKVFRKGDQPFLSWMRQHPEGFVLNVASGKDSSYLLFHSSGCHHIAGHTSTHKGNAFTTRGYFKICSDRPADLMEWAAKNRPAAKTYKSCKTCVPDIDNLSIPLAEEVIALAGLTEGALRTIKVNAYERNPIARKACLAHYGHSCSVCEFNFADEFGAFADGYIHVHHLVPLAEVGKAYEVDPIKDLRPVCPNCHTALHLGGITRSIEELRTLRKLAQTRLVVA